MNKLKTECKTKTSSGPVLDVNGDLKPDSCRLCLTTNDNMRNIFNRKLLENIKYCTGISIKKEDCLPTNICISCQTSLVVAHKFKKLCILTEQICQNVLENQIKAELTHKSSKTLDTESDDDYFNDDCIKKDFFNDSVNEICVKEDNTNDNFNRNCVKDDHPNDDFNEIKSNDNHFNEGQFNGDQFNDDNDNVIVSENNGLTVVKKEELDCEYEVNTEEVPKELLDDLEVKSHIDRPRRQPKPRKLYDGTVGNVKKVGKKRGPYRKKSDPPLRRKKFKYFKLFCETCQIKFTCKKDSDQHKETVHKETWASMCEICGKLFTYRGSFTSHIRSHLPPEHACQHCDYRTSNKYDLAKHLLIHAGTKKYHCAKCPNSYYTVSNLREHERMVHERLLRHACDICGKMFYDRTHLRRHVDSHNDVKRYECTLCRTAYTRRCYWKKHMLRQHGVHAPTLRPGRGRGHAHFAPDAPDPFAAAHTKNSAEQSIL